MDDDKVIFRPRAMAPDPFYMAPVDIIIPFHGEHDKVSKLLESIFRTIHTNRYQISLVDDASPNVNFIKEFKKVPGVVGFRNDQQKGFGACINGALVRTKQPYVLIMHSDVVVEGNVWLARMGELLLAWKEHGYKMVSPLTDNPVVDDPMLAAVRRESTKESIPVRKGKFLPMYCALCHRELFRRVGPLKEYPYAGGEAEEFAGRMLSHGFRQAVCAESWVHHDGRATIQKFDNNTKAQEILQKVRPRIEQDINEWKK
jgi:glycosyltransferase involved in cell wall biosynthesis